MAEDGDDKSMACEEDEAGKKKGKTATSRQNEKLYADESILNTKMKKAEKKRRKKAEKPNSETAMDDDYDFKVDYVKKGFAMDADDGIEDGDDDDEDGNHIIDEVIMSNK